jgi:hypothetical protein
VAEVRALPDEHLECYRHSAPDVIAKAQAVMKVNPGAVRERGCSGQSDTRCQGSAQRWYRSALPRKCGTSRIVVTGDDPKARGKPHLVSVDWVEYVDSKVHLNKPPKKAISEWRIDYSMFWFGLILGTMVGTATEGPCKLSKNKTRATTPAQNYKPDKTELCKRIPFSPAYLSIKCLASRCCCHRRR